MEETFSEQLLSVLACPVCKESLEHKNNQGLVCSACNMTYPINKRIVVLLPPILQEENDSTKKILEEKNYQDKIAENYSKIYESGFVKRRWDFPLLRKYLKHFDKDGILLDLGCGTGASSYFYSRHNFNVISSDLSTEMLKETENRNFKTKLINSAAEFIPFKDNSISQVVCFGSFHHFNDKIKSLNEIYRILKKNGKVLIVENNRKSLHLSLIPRFVRDSMQPKFKKKYGESVHEQEGRDDELSISEHKRIFARTNFRIKSIKTFYFARIVSLAEKGLASRFVINKTLRVMDEMVKLFKDKGFMVAFLLEKD